MVIDILSRITYNGEMRGEKVTTICSCGKSFDDYISNKRSKYCSLDCYWEDKKGNPGYWLGKNRPQITKDKISVTKTGIPSGMKGIKRKPHTEETKKKLSEANKGKHINSENFARGENHPNWRGGITLPNKAARQTVEYKLWRKAVFERDDYTCQNCWVKGVVLHADHIKPFAYFPELRTVIDNGRTLCVPCHSKTDTYKKKLKLCQS